MQLIDLFVILPTILLYPSFQLYVKVAKKQDYIKILHHFIVCAVYFPVILFLNNMFGSFTIYSVVKVGVAIFLIGSDYTGSGFIYSAFIGNIIYVLPFVFEFAYQSHFSSSSQLIQQLANKFEESFSRRYRLILDEIQYD